MTASNSKEIVFLGTGTSIGVPVIGCDCKVCTSDDPKNNRLRASILVRSEHGDVVIDTGPDFRQQCLREKIVDLEAVIFTHCHSDHIMGFDDLRRFTLSEDASIDIYANQETIEQLQLSFAYIFSGENKYYGYLKADPHIIKSDRNFSVVSWDISPLPVTHGKVDTLGFLFSQNGRKVFAYLPDAKTLADQSLALIQDVPILIIDGLQMKPHFTHLSISEAVEIAQQANAGETWLTHLSCKVDYQVEGPKLPPGVQFAWDGLKLDLVRNDR